ncbi:hypothetical protein AB4Z43_30190 [Mesorhizobium sp. 2RAF45]|uniref:hypothetical protein n=1 Tax=Mesorhizobium TaxID=68287 RepID=UPI001495F5E3|nr:MULTISPECIES: hypothetical protein [Mesorhizobium]MCH4560248.1 hypothetical protein [Mesorhizobium jarvisii]BCH03924.1 hypothetical protein MesoLj131b_59230 [Mesorhizobium sp. 131-2-5]BCH11688.1 hypothetical protein MesoLj131c_59460 [Mesorhizobium sp. 131-3-5]
MHAEASHEVRHGVGDRDEAEGVDEDRQADDDRAGEQIYDHMLIVAAQRRFALCKIKPMEAAFFWGAGQDPALRKYFAVDFTELQSVIC